MIQLSPGITELDVTRVEQMPNGTTMERSTRDWALQLTLSDEVTSARCDTVNGGPDRQLYILVPRPHYDEVREALSAYGLRLNLLGERETRFRDSLPDLPSVIHIDVSTQSNLDFLENLSSVKKWQLAPDSVRGGTPATPSTPAINPAAAARRPPPSSTTSSIDGDESVGARDQVMWPAPDTTEGDTATKANQHKKQKARSPAAQLKNPQSDDQTAASHRSDASSLTALLVRIQNMEKAQQEFQAELKKVVATSEEKFEEVNERLRTVDTLGATVVQSINDTQKAALSTMETKFEDMFAGFLGQLAARSSDQSHHPPTATTPSIPNLPTEVTPPTPLDLDATLTQSTNTSISATSNAITQHGTGSVSSVQSSGGSAGSTRSYPSDVDLPQEKKPRGSIQTDMSQLSLHPSDTESVLSDIYGAPPRSPLQNMITEQSPWSPTVDEAPTHHSNNTTPTTALALPDLDKQYNNPIVPEGGANG